MPSSSAPSLRRLLTGTNHAARFVADATARHGLANLLHHAAGAAAADQVRGKTVLLAMKRQLEAVAAVLQLDGVARRIIFWPQEEPADRMAAVMRAGGVDAVLTAFPLPEPDGGEGRDPGCADRGSADRGSADRGSADRGSGDHGSGNRGSGNQGSGDQGGDHGAAEGNTWHGATEWVLLTSGTTGRPKLVVHTLESLAGHLLAAAARAGASTAAAAALWCSFYDIRRYGGMQVMLRALLGGGSLVLGGQDEAPDAFLARAGAAGATHFVGTPSHWRRALMADAAARIAPRYVRLSGEVADQLILDRLRTTFPQAALVHAFASTEAGLAFEVADGRAGFPTDLLDAPGGSVALKVVETTLRVRSPRAAAGYLDGVVNRITDQDGFIDTGDVVVRQGERLHVAGRRDGTVKVGGWKVHPEEIEAVINRHPHVQLSRVSARPNAVLGAIVVAEVVCRTPADGVAGADLQEEIRAFCRGHLAAYKVPASVRIVPNLALTAAGKLARARA